MNKNKPILFGTDGHARLEKSQSSVEFRRHPMPTVNVHVQLRRFDTGERESGERDILGTLGELANGPSWTRSAKKSGNRHHEIA